MSEKPGFTVTTRDGNCTVDGQVIADPHEPAAPAAEPAAAEPVAIEPAVDTTFKSSKSQKGVTSDVITP